MAEKKSTVVLVPCPDYDRQRVADAVAATET